MGGFTVGFTGTRYGMTDRQARVVAALVRDAVELHHGDCIGADAQVHTLALRSDVSIILHPPSDGSRRAFCKGADAVVDVQNYIDRNHDIVDMTEVLVAAPSDIEQKQPRSGTWATIRYALHQGRLVYIVWPRGNLEERRSE